MVTKGVGAKMKKWVSLSIQRSRSFGQKLCGMRDWLETAAV